MSRGVPEPVSVECCTEQFTIDANLQPVQVWRGDEQTVIIVFPGVGLQVLVARHEAQRNIIECQPGISHCITARNWYSHLVPTCVSSHQAVVQTVREYYVS